MKTEDEIKGRIVEIAGDLRRMTGKCELMGFQSPEEWDVYDALCTERAVLQWVLGGGTQ